MRFSRRIVAAATTAALLPAIVVSAPAAQALPLGGGWCDPLPGMHAKLGPLRASSSYNTTRTDVCSMVQFGSWWKGINGSPDMVGLLSVPLAGNLFFVLQVEAQLASLLGIFTKPVGQFDQNRYR